MSKELYNSYFSAVNQARSILDRADREKRPLNADETSQYDRIDAEIDRLGAEMDRAAKRTAPAPAARPVLGTDRHGNPQVVKFPGVRLGHSVGREERAIAIKPGTPEALRAQDKYRQSFLGYLQSGRQQLGLQVSKDPKGGYLAPVEFVNQLITFLDNNVVMRQLATVLPPLSSAVSLGVPTWEADPADAEWTAEVPASDISEDDTAELGRRDFRPHLMTRLVKISQKLLRVGIIDPEQLLVQRLGYKFAVTEEQAYLTGDGEQKPLGVFVASTDGIPTTRDTTCACATAFTGDELIDCLYSLKEGYQRNATWLVSREFVKRCRKLKDGQNQYLWQPGLAAGLPGTILDRPYVVSEYVPSTYTTGKYVAIVGDFKTGYWIADAYDMEVQRLDQLFALRNQVGVLARKETDGAPVLAEAFQRLKLG